MRIDPPFPVWDRKTAPGQPLFFRWEEGGDLALPIFWVEIADDQGQTHSLKFTNALSVEWTPIECLMGDPEWKSQAIEANILYELDFVRSDEVLDKMGFNSDLSQPHLIYNIGELCQFCLLQDGQLLQVYAESLDFLPPQGHFTGRMYQYKP